MIFLIARPAQKAEQTALFFQQHNLNAQALGLIDIKLATTHAYLAQLNAAKPSVIIVTSSYAAQWLLRATQSAETRLNFKQINFVCVGSASAALIANIADKSRLFTASPENSEGVLNASCLRMVNNANIVILKGKGGRNLIADSLYQKNANIVELHVYERIANMSAIHAFSFETSKIRCIIATSIEITELLLANLDRTYLQTCVWIVASERIKAYACAHGIEQILLSQGASDQALLNCANQLVNTRSCT